MNLNPQQQAAVDAPITGPAVCVSAGPGSGKTHSMAYRVKTLIEQGVDPKNIIVVTLTTNAAGEMWKRIVRLMPNLAGSPLEKNVSTYHALMFRTLTKHTGKRYKVLDSDKERYTLKNQLEEIKAQCGFGSWNTDVTADILYAWINRTKALGLSTWDSKHYYCSHLGDRDGDAMYEARARFDQWVDKNGYITFADMLLKVDQLMHDPVNQKRYSGRYIIVDEGQDTTEQAMRILKLMAKGGQIWMVGDLAQTLFEFAGASPDVNIGSGFDADYPNGQRYPLQINYRSTQIIVELANQLVSYCYLLDEPYIADLERYNATA